MKIDGDFTIKQGLQEVPRSSSSVDYIQEGNVDVELLGKISSSEGEKFYFAKTIIEPIQYVFFKEHNLIKE